MDNPDDRVRAAVRYFWQTRRKQARSQGSKTGQKDYGSRSAVTGGKQIDGFIQVVAELLKESELSADSIHIDKKHVVLPGWFRPTKEWDLVALVNGTLLAVVEFKSQVGSFGNNFNNRTEEALGNSTDILTAYREGAFRGSPRPWVGYLMLLEDSPESRTPVSVQEPHYPTFPEFQNTSYADRYRILCQKLVRERLYDATCLLLSDAKSGLRGDYTEPSEEIGFRNFAASLTAHALAFARANRR
ncbi:MAG TPA: PaeR7I family type II restriction endonuclease [Terriglobia bacterium]|nr:PaeR7I family type II restriction endonuclease [Terriglobia bacterium]